MRSWPAVPPPPGRARVDDALPRMLVDGYDYRDAMRRYVASRTDDLVLLEWDIAASLEDLQCFVAQACAHPDRVLVAPYQIYASDTDFADWDRHGRMFAAPRHVFAHRVYEGSMARFVDPADATCHMFGLGMTYLPNQVIARFLREMQPGWKFDDTTFSGWHAGAVGPVRIAWDVRPVHLHFDLSQILREVDDVAAMHAAAG